MLGTHCIRTYAKTQAVIAKSSAESELYAAVRAGCEGLGALTMLGELCKEVKMRLHIDSSAAKAILERTGLQKIRHIDVDTLWMQDLAAKERVDIKKVQCERNAADLMTKHLGLKKIEEHCERVNIVFRSGRSEKSANLYIVREGGDRKGGKYSWGMRGGKENMWARIHKERRNILFAPGSAEKGPKALETLSSTRKTEGAFNDDASF